jgi:asparagine synthase (glutamine-hydrolysing)
MLRSIAHRGPDDHHWMAGPDYTLGARRLSIIDVLGGRQPLSTPDGTIVAAQNGEIYNFPDLREQLLAAGHRFASRTDTEVIPHLYQLYGDAFVQHIDGMFAISLWDKTRRRGLLVRDRAGKKPLYYTSWEGALYYASELKALLQIPGFPRRVNPEALHHYLSYKNVPCPLTIFEGIHELSPAHLLVWEDGAIQSLRRYWTLDWTPFEGELHEQELAEELLIRLRAGIKKRLISDVPIGFFLSGGLDSSLATALAAEVSPERIKTFTLRYSADSSTPGKELDLACAREVARRYDTDHYEETIDFSHFKDELPAILSHFDQPFSGVVSTYFLSRLISKHLKVAISGDGADEFFGSYLSHRLAGPLAEWDRAGTAGDLGHFTGQEAFLESLVGPPGSHTPDWKWRSKLLVFGEHDKHALYSDVFRQVTRAYSTDRYLEATFAELSARDPLNRVLEAEFHTQLPDQVLAFSDRLSMAYALEIRTAFLDTSVMEFAARIPSRFKIHGQEIKSVLKLASRAYLPSSVIDRPKEGFVMPVNQWLSGWLFEYARDYLAPARLVRHGYFRPEVVAQMLRRFQAGETGLANQLLTLLSFQIWHEIYIEQQLPLPLGEAARFQNAPCAG